MGIGPDGLTDDRFQREVDDIRRRLPSGNWDWPGADSVYARLQAIASRIAQKRYGNLSDLHLKTIAVLGSGDEETCKGHLLYLAQRGYTCVLPRMENPMTTRQDILKEFRISPRGTIQNPGKFEGEMLYAPYFYDVIMEGCGGDEFYLPQEERVYTVIVPTAEDKAEFHQLEDVIGVICFETDQGFFNVETYTVGQEKTFNLAVEELAELSEAEVEEE